MLNRQVRIFHLFIQCRVNEVNEAERQGGTTLTSEESVQRSFYFASVGCPKVVLLYSQYFHLSVGFFSAFIRGGLVACLTARFLSYYPEKNPSQVSD